MREVAVRQHMPDPLVAGPGVHSRCALLIFRREPTGTASATWTAAAPPPEAASGRRSGWGWTCVEGAVGHVGAAVGARRAQTLDRARNGYGYPPPSHADRVSQLFYSLCAVSVWKSTGRSRSGSAGSPATVMGFPVSSRSRDRTPNWRPDWKELAARPRPQPDLAALQALLDTFTSYYNHQRPHRSCRTRLPRRRVCRPAKATSGDRTTDAHNRVRTDRIDATGELLRELTLDPSRNYQPTGRKPGPKTENTVTRRGFTVSSMS